MQLDFIVIDKSIIKKETKKGSTKKRFADKQKC